jgi:beta-lactamase regulating signal transducer with metallopeptidase domain
MNAFTIVPLLAGLFVELAWKATAVVLLAALIDVVATRSAAARHAVWTAASVSLLLLPAAILAGPRWLAGRPFAKLADLTAALGGPVPFRMRVGEAVTVGRDGPQLVESAVAAGPAVGHGLAADVVQTWVIALLALCCGALIVFTLRLLRGHVALRRVIAVAAPAPSPVAETARRAAARLGLRRAPPVLLSTRTASPGVIGLLRPRVVLPQPWDCLQRETEHVLLHELAHVSRADGIRQLAAEAAFALYCWHPAVWWLARQAAFYRECAADEAVVNCGVPATAYARTLVARVRCAQQRPRAALPFAGDALHRRIASLLRPVQPSAPRWPGRLAASVVVVCTVLLATIWPVGDHRRFAGPADGAASDPVVAPLRLP